MIEPFMQAVRIRSFAMINTKLRKLTSDEFEKIVYEKADPCLVVFMRKTCHVCEEVVPVLEEMEAANKNKCSFYAVDVEEQKKLFNSFSFKSIPQILFFKDGEYNAKLTGLVEEDAIAESISKIFA